MPQDLRKRVQGLEAVHNYQSSRSPRQLIKRTAEQVERFAEGMRHPLVRRNPDSQQHAVYLNPIRIECIDGLERSESDALLDQLLEFCLQPEFYYRHRWQAGDVVLWDNRTVLDTA